MENPERKIVVIGSTNTDMVISAHKLPAPGETICGGRFMMNPGGKGANQAVAVARLSSEKNKCVFVAKLGDDVFMRDTVVRMKNDGIDAKFIIDKNEPSGTALILVDSKGQNEISVALGANGTLSPDDLAPYRDDIANASAVLMQLETPIETVLVAAQMAKAAGVPVILNPAPAAKLPKELYANLDWITPNETEAEILTGVRVTDERSGAEAAAVFKKLGVKHVIITMGSQGVYCDDLNRIIPTQKVKAIDCVAAGDTFNGAFTVALVEGMDVSDAIAFAQKAAGISVTRVGAQASVPYRAEIV